MRSIVNALLVRHATVLLARRSPDRKTYPGLWSFPGGHVEEGETLEQALVREVREEIDVTPRRFEVLDRIERQEASDDVTYHMFAVSDWQGEPRIIDAEHTELRWWSLCEAEKLSDLALDEYRGIFGSLMAAKA